MRESIKLRRLRNWKARQTAEGYDVSKVNTLEEAEHFFDKKVEEPKAKTKKELLEEALSLGLKLNNKLKNSEIEEAINNKKAELVEEEKKKALEKEIELEIQPIINTNDNETPVVEEVEVPEIKELDKDKAFTFEVDEVKEETPVEGE